MQRSTAPEFSRSFAANRYALHFDGGSPSQPRTRWSFQCSATRATVLVQVGSAYRALTRASPIMVRIGYPGRPVHRVSCSSPINAAISGESRSFWTSEQAGSGATLGAAMRVSTSDGLTPGRANVAGVSFMFLRPNPMGSVGRQNRSRKPKTWLGPQDRKAKNSCTSQGAIPLSPDIIRAAPACAGGYSLTNGVVAASHPPTWRIGRSSWRQGRPGIACAGPCCTPFGDARGRRP